MIKIFTNIITRKHYNEKGNLFRDGLPNIFFNATDTVLWQLCSRTPDIVGAVGQTPDSEWTKYTGYADYNAIGAFLTADDDYVKRMQGTLSANVSSGSVSTISATISNAGLDTIPLEGSITLFDSNGDMEVIEYTEAAISGQSVTFTIAEGTTLEKSYSSGDPMDVVQACLMQATLDTTLSDVANGLFAFQITASSRKLHDKLAYADTRSLDVKGLELAIFNIDSENSMVVDLERYEVDTFSIRSGMADTSMDAQVTQQRENQAVTLMKTLLGAGVELQFSQDGVNAWHATQSTADDTLDKYYRFRLAGGGGAWSIAIRMIDGSAENARQYAEQAQALYDSTVAVIASHPVAPAYGYGVTKDNNVLSFTWCDPADNDIVKWKCSRLIYKLGGFPANENDGEVLVDSYIHNAYKTNPFVYDMGSVSDYYFAIFTQSTGGIWNTGDDAPRFTTADLTWATIGMMSRAGTLLQYPNMQIGSVVDIKVNDLYPLLRYKLVHIDYKGTYENIGDFMYDNTQRHNSIWIPEYLPCYGDGNMAAAMIQFDSPELEYAETWDTLFLAGRTYYTVSGETFTALTAGTDYEDGTSIETWKASHSGTAVYNKNNSSRVSYGNNINKESNMRQWLNASGTGWFRKQNPFDVQSSSSIYATGWLTGFDAGFLAQVMPVYNKTARNTVSALSFGGGGGYDITLDTFWLPSMKEVFNTNINNIAEGYQFDYFQNVATSNADRIQRDNGGTARPVSLRSCFASSVYAETYISTSGASNYYYSSNPYAFLPAMCVA